VIDRPIQDSALIRPDFPAPTSWRAHHDIAQAVHGIATITLQRPNLTSILIVQPVVVTSDSVTSFDNSLDYGGSSGRTYRFLPGADSDSLCLTNPPDLALFTGAGTISLPGFATDGSYQTGASSWSIGPRPYANIRVTYNYTDCIVPVEATTWSRIKRLNQ